MDIFVANLNGYNMARGYNNYSFIVDSSFRPFEMGEMLQPFLMYKDAYEKVEDEYNNLSLKADKFKYLADTLDPDSKAAQIYNGYANDLKAQAEDLAHNGLSMGNRRALTNMRRRYQGEIGRLVEADTALQKEKELRRQMATKDPTMLYATDNLNIDSYLDNNTPNLYSVSGNDLYARGAAAGKAASARIYSDPQVRALDKYYNEYFSTEGYSPEKMQEFRDNLAAIPELQKAAMDIVKANRVGELGEGSANYNAALQQIINGIADGAIYQRQSNMQRNLGQLTAAEDAADKRAREASTRAQQQLELSAAASGYKREGDKWVLDEDAIKKRAELMGIDSYNPDDWEIGPDGKPKRKPKTPIPTTPEEKTENLKQKELLKLGKSDLGHNEGFDVTFGSDRHHYNYIGAISRHGDKWYHGAIGEDNPGHNFPRAWGWGSTSNVENAWGNFSAEGSDSKDMRVLSPDEMLNLVSTDTDLLQAIQERAQAMGVDPNTADIQLIEVPNEKGGGGQKGYLIAVH